MEILYIIIVLAIIFGIVFIRSSITRKAREASAVRERADAARFLSSGPAEPPTITAHAPRSYREDEPPPPPPPGW